MFPVILNFITRIELSRFLFLFFGQTFNSIFFLRTSAPEISLPSPAGLFCKNYHLFFFQKQFSSAVSVSERWARPPLRKPPRDKTCETFLNADDGQEPALRDEWGLGLSSPRLIISLRCLYSCEKIKGRWRWLRGTWRKRSLRAPCRTPPEQWPPQAMWCDQCWKT